MSGLGKKLLSIMIVWVMVLPLVAATYTQQAGTTLSINVDDDGGNEGFTSLQWGGHEHLWEAFLMVGTSAADLRDGSDNDWTTTSAITTVASTVATVESRATYTSGDFEVRQFAYTWSQADDDDYVIIGYVIRNTSAEQKTICFGTYVDYDIDDTISDDTSRYSADAKTAYTYQTGGGTYGGLTLLNRTPHSVNVQSYPFLVDGTDDDLQRWEDISNNVIDNDWSILDTTFVLGVGPVSLQPGEMEGYVVALTLGADEAEMFENVNNAQTKYDAVLDHLFEDSDGDGYLGIDDPFPYDPRYHIDTDNDGMPDEWETTHGLNVGVDDSQGDFDADGLVNIDEYLARADPTNPDTDGDGLLDGVDPTPAGGGGGCFLSMAAVGHCWWAAKRP